MPKINVCSLTSEPHAANLPVGTFSEGDPQSTYKYVNRFDRTGYVPAGKAAQEIASRKAEIFKLLEIDGPIVFVPIPGPTRVLADPQERWDEKNIASSLHNLKVGRIWHAIDRLKLEGEAWPDDEFSADEICQTLRMTKDGTHPAGKPKPEETVVYVSVSIDDGKLIAAVDSNLSRHARFEKDRAVLALEMRSDYRDRDHKLPMVREIHYSERGLPWPVSLSATPPVIEVPMRCPDLADSPEYLAAYLAGNVPKDKFYPWQWGGRGNMQRVSYRSVKMR